MPREIVEHTTRLVVDAQAVVVSVGRGIFLEDDLIEVGGAVLELSNSSGP